ncbi:type II toxin-antitoxin system RelB/DinJ family antitoxin [Lactobacillus sp. LC28-10]|uniref:Type II toxin-antitoxin system RelB/DinJ family antitoxin n=1 Tax=Secundilactobacillus angelensis TaxID=2722706 RepID=A0ABX1L1S0_9LACO|nr:type II toxin-antitoxin system RelB/DinJ family antitoxin [Secundilactobacillus angelensis]MCH5462666.1 type II toxin-antitoxin system RelB/DinJ family antitoxin [Secundilactobacillus angelensis]NLR19158.1 type II toxin-antitoxin system RelB/DinJ family antitoxin [Secundilactobacillus angelensis]
MFKPKNKSARINVQVDKKTKEEAQRIYAALGLNLSTAVNMFLAQTVINNSWPLDKPTLIPDDVDEARTDALHNRNLTQFDSIQQLKDHINTDRDTH